MLPVEETLAALLRTPFKTGGRTVGAEIDCLGVVAVLCKIDGLPPPDPWGRAAAAAAAGHGIDATGLAPGWIRVRSPAAMMDGDLLVFHARSPESPPTVGYLRRGCFWSASDEVGGPFCIPVHRIKRQPDEVWRHAPPRFQRGGGQ